jgi:aminoglycoside 3-N-acetyltransferase I
MKETRIIKLSTDELGVFQKLIQLFNEVFEEENKSIAIEKKLSVLLSKKEFIVFAAIHENIVVGGLTAFEMPMYTSDQSEAYLYDMAILPEFQRMGIGKKLIAAFSDYCRQHNIQNFFVEAHEEDEHAVDFYKSAGGKPEKVIHFNFEQ